MLRTRSMKFTYTADAKPVDGYTIRRGIHRGGFGEVYYAVSDAGKEVALKLLTHDLDTELRGVRQCLNLKHPNLVTTFDVKTDADGDHWVIMEYIQGASLEDVLRSFPHGLPETEVTAWMRGLLDGVEFLHQRGIVHRDLKPANVYRENGHVKIGDVGLSKQMGGGRRNQHTEAVGTVYYMAPEVAKGQYGPEVDVYSLGVMLYEMVTGRLPFDGETTAEILMKHLSSRPDLSLLPTKLRPVIAHALEKDPAKRTPTVSAFRHELRNGEPAERLTEASFLDEQPGSTTLARPHAETPRRMGDTDRSRHRDRLDRHTVKSRTKPTTEPMPVWQIGLIIAAVFMPFPFLIAAIAIFVPWHKIAWHDYGQKMLGVWPWVIAAAAIFIPWRHIHWNDAGEAAGIAVFWLGMLWVIHRLTRPSTSALPVATAVPGVPMYSRSEIWAASTLIGAASAVCLSLGGWMAFTQMFRDAPGPVGSVEDLFFFATVPTLGTLAIVTAASVMNGVASWPRSVYAGLGGAIGAAVGGLQQFLEIQRTVNPRQREVFDSIGPFDLSVSGQPTIAAYVALFVLILAVPRWAKMLDPKREQRIRMAPVLWTAGCGFFASHLYGFSHADGIVWGGTLAAATQLAAPWQPIGHAVKEAA